MDCLTCRSVPQRGRIGKTCGSDVGVLALPGLLRISQPANQRAAES
jgi:hypothetical protein